MSCSTDYAANLRAAENEIEYTEVVSPRTRSMGGGDAAVLQGADIEWQGSRIDRTLYDLLCVKEYCLATAVISVGRACHQLLLACQCLELNLLDNAPHSHICSARRSRVEKVERLTMFPLPLLSSLLLLPPLSSPSRHLLR